MVSSFLKILAKKRLFEIKIGYQIVLYLTKPLVWPNETSDTELRSMLFGRLLTLTFEVWIVFDLFMRQ